MGAGLVGAALFYGDGVITPAISVLSAVEGLKVATPLFEPYVIPISLVLLFVLFLVQRRGTAAVGGLFGPVMLVWFAVLALLGRLPGSLLARMSGSGATCFALFADRAAAQEARAVVAAAEPQWWCAAGGFLSEA